MRPDFYANVFAIGGEAVVFALLLCVYLRVTHVLRLRKLNVQKAREIKYRIGEHLK